MSDTPDLSAEDMVKATQVSQAGSQAAAQTLQDGGGRDEVRAATSDALDEKAKEVQFKLSDEDRNAIADTLIERLDGMGAFAPPPAADAPPPPPPQTPEAAADTQDATLRQQPENQPPRKRSIAERFAGI